MNELNTTFQKKFAFDILREMPGQKKEVLRNALTRNFLLTSVVVLPFGTMRVYKEGWYLTLKGTRCCFSVWAGDNDSGFTFGRKPVENSLHLIYEIDVRFNEGDFKEFE